MWQAVYKEEGLEFYGKDPIKLLEDSCKKVKMQELIHNPFTLIDLRRPQFRPEFGKLISFRLWLLERPEAEILNIGISPENLPKVIEASDTVSKIQFRKYAELWDTFLKDFKRY